METSLIKTIHFMLPADETISARSFIALPTMTVYLPAPLRVSFDYDSLSGLC